MQKQETHNKAPSSGPYLTTAHWLISHLQQSTLLNFETDFQLTSAQTSASKTLTIVTHPAPVSEMERSRAVLLTLACVLFSRTSGTEVEMRVRPGDNVVLYSDCVWKIGITVWLTNSSNEQQPPLIITPDDLKQGAFSHHAFVWNHYNGTHDLLVKNVTESDLGLYYCARRQRKLTAAGDLQHVYHYGNRTTRLALLDSTAPCADLQTPSTPPVSDCSVCWKLLVSVCPLCVLLSSTCLCCICRQTTKGEKKDSEEEDERKDHQSRTKYEIGGGGDVIYALLDITSRVQLSDICTYSEVIFEQM
ncbi:uncharacterized protein LOC108416531 [Pygocentrus nattereri]|uniref:uncharacterized protein LOC108416531 n=1 Tax=Pygocentrus nattereri TaxID=42514 RepID=UPI001890BDF3|nr:uncharacterized protein LOC108416531 [Pygocentrus nattereri]